MKKAAPAMKTNMKKSKRSKTTKNRSKNKEQEQERLEGRRRLSLPADRCENQGAG